MALLLKRPAGFDPVPAGLHHATCIRIIDLGTQKSQFAGKVKIQPKIMLIWEIANPALRQENGQPFIVAKRYTASLNDKATLKEHLKGWLGNAIVDAEEFDLTELLGKSCAVNVTHEPSKDGTKTYAEVASVSPPMAGFTVPAPQSTPAAFDLSEPDWALFAEFSEHTQHTIRKSPEYAALTLPPDAPPPIHTAAPDIKMPVDDALMQTLLDNIRNGQTTVAQVLAMDYEFTEAQRLEIEALQ